MDPKMIARIHGNEQHAEDDADDAEYQRRDGEPVGPLTSAG